MNTIVDITRVSTLHGGQTVVNITSRDTGFLTQPKPGADIYIWAYLHHCQSKRQDSSNFDKMQASKDFAVNFSKLVLYRVQPKGINPRFGAQSEPLPPNAEFNLMPKYIEAWKDEYIDAEVYHGGLVTYSVQLRKVIYTPGDHTKHKLVDSETGELVTYDCGQYAIWDMTAYKESTLKYVFSASHVEETLGRELASKLHPILHFQPNPVSHLL